MASMLERQRLDGEDNAALEARLKAEKEAKERMMIQYRTLKKTYELVSL